MISHRYKCIFIHVPKCAGTSIETAMGHYEGFRGRGGQDHRSIADFERMISAPVTARIARRARVFFRTRLLRKRLRRNPNNRLTVNKEQYRDYYKFTIVRNPWTRAFSFYEGIMRDEIHRRNYSTPQGTTFKEFIKTHAGKGLLRPQTHWLKSLDGSLNLDFVGKFESLHEDFKWVCADLGISGIELPHILKGSGKNHLAHYDDESIEIIFRIYKEDIEFFGYSDPCV